jgi:DNA-directed RNA polymerase subunit K/omega
MSGPKKTTNKSIKKTTTKTIKKTTNDTNETNGTNKKITRSRSRGGAKPEMKQQTKNIKDVEGETNPAETKEDINKYGNYDGTAAGSNNNENENEDDVLDGDGDNDDVEWNEDEEVDEDAEEEADVGDIGDDGGEAGEGGEDCSYNSGPSARGRGMKKIGAPLDKEDDDDDDDDENMGSAEENSIRPDLYVKAEDRRTTKYLTNYERVSLLGTRAAQLAQGAKPMIRGVNGLDPRTVAQLELESKMIPIKIVRTLTNNTKEVWTIDELILKRKYIIFGFTGGEVNKVKIQKINEEHKKGGSIIGYSKLSDRINGITNSNVDIGFKSEFITSSTITASTAATNKKNNKNNKKRVVRKNI